MEKLLLGNWNVDRRGHKFRNPQYCQRSQLYSAFVEARVLTSKKIFNVMYSNGTCPSTKAQDGTITRLPCPDAYGYVLGTVVLAFVAGQFLTT